jgi:hypothetical protein
MTFDSVLHNRLRPLTSASSAATGFMGGDGG